LGGIQMGEQNNIYWSMGFFSVTIIYLIIDYNRVVENVRTSALMLGFLVAILGYLSELRYRLFPDLRND
jgi:hypothetical protein